MELQVSDLNVVFSDRQCLFTERIVHEVSAPGTPVPVICAPPQSPSIQETCKDLTQIL